MDRYLSGTVVGVIFVLVVLGVYVGWRTRSREQLGRPALDPVPSEIGEMLLEASGLYVGTTLVDQPLERVMVQGLGFRSRATAAVARAGIVIALTGQEPMFIAQHLLRSVQRATWAIDKAVEKGGLVVIAWQFGDYEVDSYFRLDGDPDNFVTAGDELLEVQE